MYTNVCSTGAQQHLALITMQEQGQHAETCQRMLTYAIRVSAYSHTALDERALAQLRQIRQQHSSNAHPQAQPAGGQELDARRLGKLEEEEQWTRLRLGADKVLTYAHVCSRMLTYAHVCSRVCSVC
jgi:hypothetical protein